MRVHLNVGWLSENDLLVKAGQVLGIVVDPKTATEKGCQALTSSGPMQLEWELDLLFTLAQLKELGFE
jgi:hypothetical protein